MASPLSYEYREVNDFYAVYYTYSTLIITYSFMNIKCYNIFPKDDTKKLAKLQQSGDAISFEVLLCIKIDPVIFRSGFLRALTLIHDMGNQA